MSSELPPPAAQAGAPADDASPAPASDPSLFRHAFDVAEDALLVIDTSSATVVAANRAGTTLLGTTETPVVGQSLAGLALLREHPTLCAACLALRAGDRLADHVVHARDGDGIQRTLELTARSFSHGARTFVQLSLHDVTATRLRAQRDQQARKLEAVRLLAGATAHDFNNVLSCIRGYVSIALETAGVAGELREILTRVKDVSLRAGELPQRLLDFSRQRKLTLQPLDLSRFVQTIGPELRSTLPEGITLQVSADAGAVPVNADEQTLRLAVTLLFRNAREAMGDQGELALGASRWSLPPALGRTTGTPETYARLSVRDSGRGMTRETQERLFEPGFTTKKSGRSAGMSLSTVYRIAAQHGGWMEVESAPDRGSTFAMILPLATPSAG